MVRALVPLVIAVALLALVPMTIAAPSAGSGQLLSPGVQPSEAGVAASPGTPPAVPWTTYLFGPEREGANLAERTIAPSNVSNLTEFWTLPENGSDFSAPIVVNNTLYYGSWNGYEYAVNVATGTVDWSVYLGTDPGCGGYQPMGISSTPAYGNGTLYLGGGDGYWYALNATTGDIEWSYDVGALPQVNNYDWASALVYGKWLYIGVSSCFDNPLIQGAILQVNLTGIHTANHIFYTIPAGQVGDSIWTTPALDPTNNTIWVSTGNENTGYPEYANAIIGLNATTLTYLGSWQVPNVAGQDSDFGSTPTLYSTASGIPMIVATNKNGEAYALNRSNVSMNGTWFPAWSLGTGGGFSSGAYYGNTLFLAGDALYAVDPNNGTVRWENTDVSSVYSALTWANGIVYVGSGDSIYAIDGDNGTTLWNATVPGDGSIVAEPVVDDGYLYVPSGNYGTEGNLTAYGLPFTASATASTNHGIANLSVRFHSQAEGGLTPYHFAWSFGDGTFGTGSNPVHNYLTSGNHTAEVWMNDSAGRTVTKTFTIDVMPGIVSSFEWDYMNFSGPACPGYPTSHLGPEQVGLSLTTSGGVPPYSYRWSLSNGITATTPTILVNFTQPFTANVTITDSEGHELNLSTFVGYPVFAQPPLECLPLGPWTYLIVISGLSIAVVVAVVAVVLVRRRRRRTQPPPTPPPPD
jgi:outer membrane protein assembly factor BamB